MVCAGWGIRVGSNEAIQHLLRCPGWPGVGAGTENPSGLVQVLETTPFQGTHSQQELAEVEAVLKKPSKSWFFKAEIVFSFLSQM